MSFGLVRMANFEPLVDVALALYRLGAPPGMRLHLCVYHSRYQLLLRSAIEHVLDRTLDRRDEGAGFRQPAVRARLDAHAEADQVFVVLGSPVTEVGRDHDYDWAVVEPSSMRSLIQIAGRVWRHRPLRECTEPNIVVLDHNLRFWAQPDEPAYMRPGFETRKQRLPRRALGELLRASEREVIDARPRILPQNTLRPDASLFDLEHARLLATMRPAPETAGPEPAATGGRRQPPLATHLPSAQHALCSHHWWTPKDPGARDRPMPYVEADRLLERVPDAAVAGERIAPWNAPGCLETLSDLAAAFDRPLHECAQRYGQVTLPAHDRGWRFHPALGFTKRR